MHQKVNILNCDSCGISSFPSRRLSKHEKGDERQKRYCHYYNTKMECPFEETGCKFKHIHKSNQKFGPKCEISKRQYKHQDS